MKSDYDRAIDDLRKSKAGGIAEDIDSYVKHLEHRESVLTARISTERERTSRLLERSIGYFSWN